MSLVDELREQDRAWSERPLVRALYRDWFHLIASRLAPGPGPTVELGAGIARFRDVVPDVLVTDVEPTPWSDAVVDAESLPYEDGSVANLVLVDVFHHLPRPDRFLDEAVRTLREGGRVVMLEPYCSPLSAWAYRRFHHEPVDLDADPFAAAPRSTGRPMDSNTALPTLAFFHRREELERRRPGLKVVEAKRLAVFAYPLSGGFSRRPLVPARLLPLLRGAELVLAPLRPFAAFRCLVVLERQSATGRTRSA